MTTTMQHSKNEISNGQAMLLSDSRSTTLSACDSQKDVNRETEREYKDRDSQ